MNIFNFLDPAWLALISAFVVPPIPGGPTQSSNLLVWVRADAMTGYTHNQPVPLWTNFGSASNLVQLIAANQAVFYTNAFAGGKPSIRFTNDYYIITNGFPTQNLRGAELFVVLKANADPAAPDTGVLFDWNSSTSGNEAYPGSDGKITSFFYSTNEPFHTGIPRPIPMTTRQVFGIQVTNDHMVMRQNGQLFYVSDICTLGMRTGHLNLGRGWTGIAVWPGDIAELLCYGVSMNDNERMSVFAGLGRKYGIAIAGDPYTYPPNLPATPRFWFRASDLDATLTDGAAVSNWLDRSANSLNVTQLTTAAMPEFKTGIVGGKSVLRFTTAKSLTFQTQQLFQGSAPFACLAVMKPNADCSVVGDPVKNIQFRARTGNNNVTTFWPEAGGTSSGTFRHAASDWQLNIFNRDATGFIVHWQNATPSGYQGAGNGSGFTSIGGGIAGVNMNGDLAEFIWYDNVLTTNQIYYMYEFYFRERYQGATGLW